MNRALIVIETTTQRSVCVLKGVFCSVYRAQTAFSPNFQYNCWIRLLY